MTPEQKRTAQAKKKRWCKRNPEKAARYKAKHYRNNRNKYLTMERERAYKKLYGITVADYDAMLATQDGRCKICGGDKPGKKHRYFSVDHCHKTGRVRGLLCTGCNVTLGRFEAHRQAALTYLKETRN